MITHSATPSYQLKGSGNRTASQAASLTSRIGRYSAAISFRQILARFSNRCCSPSGIQARGWTARDYLAHPVKSIGIQAAKADHETASFSPLSSSGPIQQMLPQNHPNKSLRQLSTGVTQKKRCVSPPSISVSGQVRTNLSESVKIERCIQAAAQKYRIPANLIKGIIKAESNFKVHAVSSAGAQGLMQLMPATAAELGVEDAFDIKQNIDGGTRYFRRMLDSFDGDVKIALAAYNAGPGTVKKYGAQVPYQETRLYVKRVLRFASQMA